MKYFLDKMKHYYLTHFQPMFHFYTPWKHQKIRVFCSNNFPERIAFLPVDLLKSPTSTSINALKLRTKIKSHILKCGCSDNALFLVNNFFVSVEEKSLREHDRYFSKIQGHHIQFDIFSLFAFLSHNMQSTILSRSIIWQLTDRFSSFLKMLRNPI